MRLTRRLLIPAIILTLLAPLFDSNVWLFALQNPGQSAKPAAKPPLVTTDQQLNNELHALVKEIRELHQSQRHMLDVMLLQVEQTRAEKLEDKLSVLESQLRNLMSNESQLDWRLSHLENELVVRNIINRQEGEIAVRAELQGQLEQVRAERLRVEADVQKLRQQTETLNQRLELIRARLSEGEDGQSDETTNTNAQPAEQPAIPAELNTEHPQPSPTKPNYQPQ